MTITRNTVNELYKVNKLIESNKLDPNSIKFADALKLAKENEKPGYWDDHWFWRIAIIFMCGIILAAFVGAIVLVYYDKSIPDMLTASVGTLIGALAGLFVTQVAASQNQNQ